MIPNESKLESKKLVYKSRFEYARVVIEREIQRVCNRVWTCLSHVRKALVAILQQRRTRECDGESDGESDYASGSEYSDSQAESYSDSRAESEYFSQASRMQGSGYRGPP